MRKAIETSRWSPTATRTSTSIGIADDELEAAVQVFYVAAGRVVGRKGFVLDKVEELTPGGLVDRILESCTATSRRRACRSRCSCRSSPTTWRPTRSGCAMLRGSQVQIRVPQRGDKRALLETVTRNAQEEFTRHRLRRASDHNTRSRALTELQELLGLPEAPLRIECYDMAHLQGTDYVGSMVVLEDGLPNKREYRRFKVNVARQRRLRGDGGGPHPPAHRLPRRARPAAARARRPAGQVRLPAAAAGRRRRQGPARRGRAGRRELGLADEIPVAGLAKRFEEVFVPGRSEPVEIPRGSEALFMLQRIRDEAHRFANTFHGERRCKRMTASALDGIPGLGETRKKRLVKALGGVNAVKRPSLDELRALPFLPDAVAEAIHAKFHPTVRRPSSVAP